MNNGSKAASLSQADLTNAIENAARLAGDRVAELGAADVENVGGGITLAELPDIIFGLIMPDGPVL